jgi:hypothetical protein
LIESTSIVIVLAKKVVTVKTQTAKGVGVAVKSRKYHCSFCEKYPQLTEQGIKKLYIFDEFSISNKNNSSYVGYYQCIDMDNSYP